MRGLHSVVLGLLARSEHRRRGTGRRTAELEAVEALPAAEAEAVTLSRLRSLLAHAFAQVPYYTALAREQGLRADDVRSLEDLQRLPVQTKALLQECGAELRAAAGFRGPVKMNHTGGSTGTPLDFAQCQDYRDFGAADKVRLYERCHYQLGQPLVFLWGSDYDSAAHKSWPQRVFDRVGQNLIWVNTFALSEELLRGYARQIARHDPVLIVGYVASLTLYARLLQARDLPRPRPRALQTSAEVLTPADRALLTEVFGCPVFDRYGCREVGVIAHECAAHHGLHVSLGNNIVELLDAADRPVGPGEVGRVVVTNLRNRAQPFLRYETGDLARWAEPADCPLTSPRLAAVVGRTTDNIVTPGGRILHGEFFTHLFYGVQEVRQFQVVQKTREHLLVRLVPAPGADLAPLCARLRQVIAEHGDPALVVECEEVATIPTSNSGKYRFTVSEVSPPW